MGAEVRNQIIDTRKHLFNPDGGLIALPTTPVDLVASSQILRGAQGFDVKIEDDTIVFTQGKDTYRLVAGQIGPQETLINRLPVRWGATVKGKTAEEDRIEIHVLCPPQISNVGFA